MPNQPRTPGRSARVPDRLWKPLQRLARERPGETTSSLLNHAIEEYLERQGISLSPKHDDDYEGD